MRRCILAGLLSLTVSATAAEAAAQVEPYVGIGLGPAINIDDWPNQVLVEQEIGLTFGGKSGFFLAFAPYQSWGNDFWVLAFRGRLGGVADLFRGRDVRFQLGGSGTVGVAASDFFDSGRDVDGWFHLSGGLLLRVLILDDRLAIYARPLTFEFAIGDSGRFGNEAVRYVAVGGIQYYF